MARPHLSKIDSWRNYEARVLEVFSLALSFLSKESELPKEEVDINRELYKCINHAHRQLSEKNRGLVAPPGYDSKNAPDADDQERARREEKRPDFSCGLYDDQEPDPQRSAKFYVVECKRLGLSSSTWKLNKNYVDHGICRFVEPEWGYGKSVSSSAMVGYVQSMELQDILAEVNDEARKKTLATISLSAEGWKERGVSRLDQSLIRSRIAPREFHLRHMWVDLRGEESPN